MGYRKIVAGWQRSFETLFRIAGIKGHAHRFRDTFAVRLLSGVTRGCRDVAGTFEHQHHREALRALGEGAAGSAWGGGAEGVWKAGNVEEMYRTDNLLVTIEKQFPEKYREYYGIKRQNFFAGVTNFPGFWDCYLRLDDIFMHEFDDIRVVSDPNKAIPLMLFAHAHAQFRIYLELSFTGSFCEAFNIARMAIESSYQARKILSDPPLQAVWTRKDRK
jgi:hypothetical protein